MSKLHADYYADSMHQISAPLERNDQIGEGTYLIRVAAEPLAKALVPGQFVMVRLAGTNAPLIGRALAVYDVVSDDSGEPIWIDQDSRDHGVAVLGKRFKLDHEQAERVSKVCSELWQQVKDEWQVDQIIHQKMLGWAANLHEIGINIAYNQNHKHGSYIIENSDIDGFSRHHQRTLALLVRSHRQKFPHMLFDGLSASLRQSLFYLAVLLRLGVAFSRGRTDTALPSINLSARPQGLTLHIAKTWCEQHPLTVMDIQSEQHYLSAVGFDLKLEQVQTQ